MLPDGSTVPIEEVPDEISDADLKARVYRNMGFQTKSTLEDVGRGAASGVPFAAIQTATLLPKTILGLLAKANEHVNSPIIHEYLKDKIGQLSKVEQGALNDTGAGYSPETKGGQYAKSMVAGAVMPTKSPVNLALGAAGGAAAQAAEDAGLGPAGGVVGAMAPLAVGAGIKAMRPGYAFGRVRDAVEGLTEGQRQMINQRMNYATRMGLDPMLWQVAGEETGLRRLGTGAASNEFAKDMQTRIQDQYPKVVERGQETVRKNTRRAFPNKEPIDEAGARNLREVVLQVGDNRSLMPTGAGQKYVNAVADSIGKDVKVQWTPDQMANRVKAISQELINLDPADVGKRAALQAERASLLRGIVPEETQFQQNVKNFGHLEDVRQTLDIPAGGDIGPLQGVKWAIDKRLQMMGRAMHPPYKDALEHYGRVKDTVDTMGDAVKTTAGRHMSPQETSSARLALESAVPYALATNPAWALVPAIRKRVEKTMVQDYGDMFKATSLEELAKAAEKNPMREAMARALLGGMAPSNQGYVQVPDEPRKRGPVIGE